MGHRSGGLALESYVKPTETDLLEGNDKMIGYIGVMDALTIDSIHRLTKEIQTETVIYSASDVVLPTTRTTKRYGIDSDCCPQRSRNLLRAQHQP
jgi:hypothetical protein